MENLFIKYFWLAPIFWIVVTVANRILGRRIAAINQETIGYVSLEFKESLGFLYILRLFLFIPVIIYFWWFFTKFLAWDDVYLYLAGYHIVLWCTAVIRQLSTLFLHSLFIRSRLDRLFDKEELLKTMKINYTGSAAEYFGYFLVYLLVVVLTQSWFIAGGATACLIAVLRYIRKATKTAETSVQIS